MIKDLREKTQAGMVDCKKALTECDGDLEKAADFLRKKGLAAANKRMDRVAKEGVILIEEADGGKTVYMLQLNCETDFVAKNDDFKALAAEILKKAIASGKDSISKTDALPADIEELIKGQIAKTGENTALGGFVKTTLSKTGLIAKYIHSNNKIGVLLELNCEPDVSSQEGFKDLAKDITMQIAAVNPQYLVPAEVPADAVEREKDIYREQMKDSGKPAPVIEKIIEGKLGKFYSEICLLEQEFVKENSKKIKDLVKERSGSLKTTITVAKFVRFQIG
jgi:elongation factor Ts